ncbi:MAG: methionine aminotransferase [Ferruginibacter sp.]|nr:methionine aminotransferase [Cytophagales bacterium]
MVEPDLRRIERPASKLPNVGTTIFTVMSRLAAECGAINLAQGFPDFPCSEELVELVSRAMRAGHNQYAPMEGLMALREQIAGKTERCYGHAPDPVTEITVTCGATEALFAAVAAVVGPGDEVIVLEPSYDSYLPAIELQGGKAVPVALRPADYSVDWPEVKAAVSERTRLIILNSPHNPTGAILRAEDLAELKAIVSATNVLVLSDEVYEHLVFDGEQHRSLLGDADLRARSLVVSSFGKTFHTTGWKTGYCVAPAWLTTEFRKVHQFLTFSNFTPVQYALAEYLKEPAHYQNLPDFYQAKRRAFGECMKATPFRLLPSYGTYFQLASFDHLSNESDVDFAVRLTREAGVAAIPVSVFYRDHTDHRVIRFCFAKRDETIEKAAERLSRF